MRIHLISIGGAVMHNIALDLHQAGHRVTGSDDEIFEPSKSRLNAVGLLPQTMGWDANNITMDIDVVILGMHARPNNPELLRAQELGCKIESFPEFVYNRSTDKKRVVVAGSHGKTSTTAMIMHVLVAKNIRFDYLVGSKLDGFERMVKISDAPLIILEGDEYLSSPIDMRPKFLWYKPHLAIITGIAWDHINVFPSFEGYVSQFEKFIDTLQPGGEVFYYESDEHLQKLCLKREDCTSYTAFDYAQKGHLPTITWMEERYGMGVFGKHNLENMRAATLVLERLGIQVAESLQILTTFTGTARRLENLYESDELTVFRDFAHAPSKLQATMEAVRSAYPNSKLVAAFELHTFSSLNKAYMPHYKSSMDLADEALVYYNEHVFEMKKMEVLSAEYVEEQFGDVGVTHDPKKLVSTVIQAVNPNKHTVVLLMSSGNFSGVDWMEELGLKA
ncbi:MAG: UDP-N-acetylmuramate: L-alanyl-gamma-D-glutamyl-meso-diaminopimelate ligase [Bacteroidia bacterium]